MLAPKADFVVLIVAKRLTGASTAVSYYLRSCALAVYDPECVEVGGFEALIWLPKDDIYYFKPESASSKDGLMKFSVFIG